MIALPLFGKNGDTMSTNVGSVNIAVTGNTDPLNNSLAASIRAVEKYAQALSESMKDSEKDVAKSTANAGDDVEEFSSGSLGLIEGFAAGFSAAITGFVIEKLVEMGATFMDVATRGMEFSGEVTTAMNQVQAQTGATSEEMVGLKESMLDIYSSGFVENVAEAGQAMSVVSRITNETGDALVETTTDALAFSKAFDSDVNTVMAATRGMMDGFGISAEQSMDLAAYAIQKTGDPAGDLLDTFKEYSPLMEKVGLNAEQFTAALMGGLEGGAFNTDLIGDAFKEFGISLMDSTDEVGARMATVLAAGGDEGAQAWLDIQDEIAVATDDVESHKEAVDAAKEEWDKTNEKVKEYKNELDKAWADLQKLLNPDMDLSEFTDKLDEIEGREIDAKLDFQPVEEGYDKAQESLDDKLKAYDDQIRAERSKLRELQKEARDAVDDQQVRDLQDQLKSIRREVSKTEDKGAKEALNKQAEALQEEIDAVNENNREIKEDYQSRMEVVSDSITQLGELKDAEKMSFDEGSAKKAYESGKDKLSQYGKESEATTLLMQKEQMRQKKERESYIESQGLSVEKIEGKQTESEWMDATTEAINRHRSAQQKLNEVTPANDAAKVAYDQAQASYDQAVSYLDSLKTEFADMPNPGKAIAENFKKGGPEAAAAMQELAKNLMIAKETMSGTDFQALVRDMGFGTMAEELGADALGGIFQKILDPGDIAAKAAGTVDEIGAAIRNRWTELWSDWDRVFEPLGEQMNIIKSRVLPVLENIVQYFGLRIAPALERVGKSLDQVASRVFPKIETFVMDILVTRVGPWLDWFATWLSENSGWLADLFVTLADNALWLWDNLSMIGLLLGGGGILGGALAAIVPMVMGIWAAAAPMFAMLTGGTLTASLTAFGATLTATFGTIAAPLVAAGLAIAAFALAWSTNFGGVRDITTSVMTAISNFIADRLAFMVAWWTKYGADVMVVVNGLLTVIQMIFGAILLFITTAAEGYRLLWAKFGDDIMAIIGVAVGNIMLVIQGLFSVIGEIFGIFADLIKGNWSGVWEHFVNIMTIQKDTIMGIWNNILGLFGTNIDGIVNYFADLPGRIAAYFSPEALIKIATDAMQAFSDTIAAMMPSLPDPSDLMGGLPSLSGAMSSAQNLVSGTAASVTGAIPSPTSNSFNQSLSFNRPGASAEDIAAAVRRQTIDLLGQAMS